MSTWTTRHDTHDDEEITENDSVDLVPYPDRVVSPRTDWNPSPQVIHPTAIHPGAYAHPHQILDPLTVSRLMGSPTRTPPRWLVGIKDLFGHAADNHILPALGVLTMAGISAMAHSEPYHPLIGGGIITVGMWLIRSGITAHKRHGNDADPAFTKGVAGAGATLVMAGTSAAAGLSWWTATAVAVALGVAYTGWHQWGHHKLERTREYSVALVAAGNTGPAPLPPAAWAPGALPQSDEEFRLTAALAKHKGEGVILSPVRRVNEDVWYVFADLSETDASPESLEQQAKKIAGRMRARRIEIEPGNREDLIKITVHDGQDPLAEPQPWPGPRITSILEPVPLGRFEDGSEITLNMAWGHTLVAGTTDGGKSGVVNAILLGTLGCKDLVRILVDCKAGAPEFRAYKDVAFHVAASPEEGMRTLAGLRAVYEYRGNLLAEKDVPFEVDEDGETVRKWRPEYGPFILAGIDELAELTKNVKGSAKAIQSLRAVQRFIGEFSLDATQTPSRGVFDDSTDARLNYRNRIGLQTAEQGATNMILGQGMHGRNWRLDLLDLPGKMMVLSREHRRPRVSRAYMVTDQDIARTVAQYRGQVPELDEGSAQAFWDAYWAWGQDEESGDGGGGGPRGGGRPMDAIEVAQAYHRDGRTLYAVPTYPNSNTVVEAKYRPLWALLGEQDEPVSAPDLDALAKSAGHEFNSESWIRRPLRYWRDNGWIEVERRSGTDYYWRPDVLRQRRDADGAAS
ncbi:FtsK/SpoIIIE domain-containing protein [Actinocrinis sp.]|uniref:FtsK/SpoIIIE domain-containing protein n=1 Tax=Actinocrinis sp. TaxID=1920516 RepID=UPI002D60B1F5|nr:FtsK/SpoIIIE domain-containing protein [Actinocrinis sp.]HZP54610.1 FtsK/SpoIIIE domain-containing protein [Actinocrinis sp.]